MGLFPVLLSICTCGFPAYGLPIILSADAYMPSTSRTPRLLAANGNCCRALRCLPGQDHRPAAWTGFKDTVRAMRTVAQDHSHMNTVHHHEQEQSLDKIE